MSKRNIETPSATKWNHYHQHLQHAAVGSMYDCGAALFMQTLDNSYHESE